MAKTWPEIEALPDFQKLPDDQRALIQKKFFEEEVSPKLAPDERDKAKEFFFAKFPYGNQDPAYGQSTLEGIEASGERGFKTGLTQTFVTGPGAILSALGADDNPLLQKGKEIEAGIREDAPVSRENQEKFIVKAANAVGQAGSMVLTAPLAGPEMKAAGWLYKTRQLALMGGVQGAAAGEAEATRLGITDPGSKAAMILGFGTIEGMSERIGGYGVEQGLWKLMRGEKPTAGFVKRLVTGGTVEGVEEVGAGVPQRGLAKLLATEDPGNPGFTVDGQAIFHPADVGMAIEEFQLGAVAGGAMVSVHGVFNAMTPQQKLDTLNVAPFPDDHRRKAFDALQRVNREEAAGIIAAKNVDPSTEAAMRVAYDGRRANVLEKTAAVVSEEFKPGWEQREKEVLVHTGEEQDAYFENGEWLVSKGTDAQGQAIMEPAPHAAELEKGRQEFIRTGEMPEGMQPLQVEVPAPAGSPTTSPEIQPTAPQPAEAQPAAAVGQPPAAEATPVAPAGATAAPAESAPTHTELPSDKEVTIQHTHIDGRQIEATMPARSAGDTMTHRRNLLQELLDCLGR